MEDYNTQVSLCVSCSADRRAKETQMVLEEEKANSQRLQDQVNQLNTKMRNLRREKEDIEAEAEGMRSKVRSLRSQVEEAEENASNLQTQITKLRAASRKARVSW